MISAEIVDVTPEMAEEWLKVNTHNRPKSPGAEAVYAGAMQRGEWLVVCDAVGFVGRKGREKLLLNGQTRLTAIVMSGLTIPMLVVWGLAPEAQEAMDTGRARRLSHALSLRDELHATMLGGALVQLDRYLINGSIGGLQLGGNAPKSTRQQLLKRLDEHPAIRDSAMWADSSKTWRAFYPSMSTLAAVHYLFVQTDAADTAVFFERLFVGAGMEADDPIFVLRERLLRERGKDQGLPMRALAAFTIKAFNAWRRGETFSRLAFTAGGARPDRFPRIYGCPIVAESDKTD